MSLLTGDGDRPGHAGGAVAEHEAKLGTPPPHGISLDAADAPGGGNSLLVQDSPAPAFKSPLRHHQRNASHHRAVKETLNAHSEYTNNEEDGKAEHRINQYLIMDEIGRGSCGSVHLAIDQYGTEYAVKEFSKSRLRKRAQSNILRRPHAARPLEHLSAGVGFNAPLHQHSAADIHNNEEQGNPLYLIKEEIAIMKKLDHPNLVPLIEVLDDPEEDSLYMVLEMCKKGVIMKVDLNNRAEPYDVESCRCWFRDLMLGIEYLHAQGIAHRDIKPDNLLLTDDDVLKVVDFGISEMFEKSSEMLTTKSSGSPAFLPPELCVTKHGDISGKAADIWSMGVSLYCLRFGRIPFERSGVLAMYEAITNSPVEIDPSCEPELKDLLNRLLDKNPKTRITMAEMRDHPWVTKNGEDPLLSAEENTTDFIETPSDLEVNHAITIKMRNLIVLMKAVTKFKSLLHKSRPTGLDGVDAPPHTSGSAKTDRRNVAAPSTDGTHHDDVSSSAEPTGVTDYFRQNPKSPALAERSSSSDTPKPKRPERVHTSASEKGQAHDPLTEEPLFLGIGAGRNNSFGPPGQEEVPDDGVIAESPLAAEFSIYEHAYQQEVERIRGEQGHRATVYLNRRVDSKDAYKGDDNMVQAPSKSSLWGQVRDHLLEKGGESQSRQSEQS